MDSTREYPTFFLAMRQLARKGPVTIRNCLLHNAGLPPDPTPHNFWEPAFGCAGAPLPANMTFACSEKAYAAVLGQQLRPGAVIGAAYLYSDISFLTLMYVVGAVVMRDHLVKDTQLLPACRAPLGGTLTGQAMQCAFEAFVRHRIFTPMGMADTGYLPARSKWPRCAPTTVPIGEQPSPRTDLQGVVEDGNAYMLGGIAGHAGLFSTARDLIRIAAMWMGVGTAAGAPQLLSTETVRRFTPVYRITHRALALWAGTLTI